MEQSTGALVNVEVFQKEEDKSPESCLVQFNLTLNYNYKVEYFKGKDNACPNFLSRKDEHKKLPVLSTEELATQIFRPQFRFASRILDADAMITDISSVGIPPQALIDVDVKADTPAMTKQPIDQTTLSRPLLPTAQFKLPPVEAIAISMQTKIRTAQDADPAISKIVGALQMATAPRQLSVFFTEETTLYCQTKDQQQLVLPPHLSIKLFNSTAQRY
uniref:Uncharacterized protein n=1 Tax=Romanomermis culicivorax TaxID=13658 RepID=A0A915J1G2_ROMCU